MEIFKIVMLIIGSIIGAGFASGKEIEVFFTSKGNLNIVSLIILFLGFFVTIKQFLFLGKKYDIDDIYSLNKCLFKKSKIFDYLTTIIYFIICGAMISGISSLFMCIFDGVLYTVFMFIVLGILVFVTTKNLNFISIINAIFIPVIIIFIFLLGIIKIDFSQIKIEVNFLRSLTQILYVLFYIGINVYLSSALISACNIKKYKLTSLVTSGILSILVLMSILILKSNITSSDLPYLQISSHINKFMYIFCIIVIFLGIFTTVISTTKILSNTIRNNDSKKNEVYYALIVVGISYVISLIGFSNIVSYLYPVIGLIGFYYCIKSYLVK